jgi:type IX secretion system PorP/SprF family membrane protein
MKQLKRFTILVTAMCFSFAGHAQQGPQFSQFMFNKLVINPAYAGAEENLSITAVSRRQWTTIQNAPSTQSLSAHTLLHHRVGLGIAIIHDRIGIHQYTNAMGIYAYHIKVGRRSYASMGLQGGIINFKSDYPTLNVAAGDPKLANFISATKINIGTGLYFRSPKFDAGLSLPGLMSRRVNFNDSLSVKFRNADVLLFTIYRFKLNDKLVMEPGVLFKYFPELSLSYDVNTNLIYKKVITVGISYRANESVDAILKLQLTEKMEAGYAYDYPINNSATFKGVSHEVMIHYVFRKSTRNIVSPR